MVVAFRAFVQHERERGAAEVTAAVEAAVTAERERVRKEEEEKRKTTATIGEVYVDKVTKPVAPAPVVRVCQPAAGSAGRVLPTTRAPELPDATSAVRAEDQGFVTEDWDTTPTVTAGRDADAQVVALQEYITHVCLRR